MAKYYWPYFGLAGLQPAGASRDQSSQSELCLRDAPARRRDAEMFHLCNLARRQLAPKGPAAMATPQRGRRVFYFSTRSNTAVAMALARSNLLGLGRRRPARPGFDLARSQVVAWRSFCKRRTSRDDGDDTVFNVVYLLL